HPPGALHRADSSSRRHSNRKFPANASPKAGSRRPRETRGSRRSSRVPAKRRRANPQLHIPRASPQSHGSRSTLASTRAHPPRPPPTPPTLSPRPTNARVTCLPKTPAAPVTNVVMARAPLPHLLPGPLRAKKQKNQYLRLDPPPLPRSPPPPSKNPPKTVPPF